MLRKRLKGVTREVHDSFPPYVSAFRRRFGIQNDQALDLFHQTVSMKSVGNLTDFVRQHMLQPFPVEERIANLVAHVDDLTRAHEAVLRAKEQLRRLTPLVEDCDQHQLVSEKVLEERACREALKAWFAAQRVELLGQSLAQCGEQLAQLSVEVSQAEAQRTDLNAQRDGLKQDIARNGGERIERIKQEIGDHDRERRERVRRFAVGGIRHLRPAFSAPRKRLLAGRMAAVVEQAG